MGFSFVAYTCSSPWKRWGVAQVRFPPSPPPCLGGRYKSVSIVATCIACLHYAFGGGTSPFPVWQLAIHACALSYPSQDDSLEFGSRGDRIEPPFTLDVVFQQPLFSVSGC